MESLYPVKDRLQTVTDRDSPFLAVFGRSDFVGACVIFVVNPMFGLMLMECIQKYDKLLIRQHTLGAWRLCVVAVRTHILYWIAVDMRLEGVIKLERQI